MKTIRNIGDSTIQIRLYGRIVEIPVNQSVSLDNFIIFDEKGRDEILNFLALKLSREGYKLELVDFGNEIECPCCKTKVNLEENKEETEASFQKPKNAAMEEETKESLKQPIKPKRGRKKKEI